MLSSRTMSQAQPREGHAMMEENMKDIRKVVIPPVRGMR